MGILNTVLGGGMSSRLFQEIREKRGLAYSVYSFNQGYSDAATFGLYAGCSAAKAIEVTSLMLEELEKVATEGITKAELEHFVDPLDKSHPKFENVANVRMILYSAKNQTSGEAPSKMTIGEAVKTVRFCKV
jgi:Zn-dependent M16 (insulinase) family peptidase